MICPGNSVGVSLPPQKYQEWLDEQGKCLQYFKAKTDCAVATCDPFDQRHCKCLQYKPDRTTTTTTTTTSWWPGPPRNQRIKKKRCEKPKPKKVVKTPKGKAVKAPKSKAASQ